MNNSKVKTRYHLNGSGNLLAIRQTNLRLWDTPEAISESAAEKCLPEAQRWDNRGNLSCWVSKALFPGHTWEEQDFITQKDLPAHGPKCHGGKLLGFHFCHTQMATGGGESSGSHLAQKTCKYTSVPTRPEARVTGSWSAVTVTLTCGTDCLFLTEQRHERTDHS